MNKFNHTNKITENVAIESSEKKVLKGYVREIHFYDSRFNMYHMYYLSSLLLSVGMKICLYCCFSW